MQLQILTGKTEKKKKKEKEKEKEKKKKTTLGQGRQSLFLTRRTWKLARVCRGV